MLEYLLDKCGANVDAPNYSPDMAQDECQTISEIGRTPLLHAIGKGNYENTDVLVKYGADVNSVVDKFGKRIEPSLIHACRLTEQGKYRSMDIVEFLVKNGADVNLRNHEGLTALHQASRNENHDLIRILLDNGAEYYWNGLVDVLPYVAMFDRQDTMTFIIENSKQPDGVIADAYEVLGARAILAGGGYFEEATGHWTKAMEIRYKNKERPCLKTLSRERHIFLNEREPQTMQELLELLSFEGDNVEQADVFLGIHSMSIYERVIGEDNIDYIEVLKKKVHYMESNLSCADDRLKILEYALSLCLKHDLPCEMIVSILNMLCRILVREIVYCGPLLNFFNVLEDGITPGKKLNINLNNSFNLEIMTILIYSLLRLIKRPGDSDSNDSFCEYESNAVDPDMMKDMLEFCSRIVNPVDKHNRSLLHIAMGPLYEDDDLDRYSFPNLKLTELLIQSGFDIDWRDDKGNTCLMNLIDNISFWTDENIVRCLLQAGPHADIRNKFGMNCLDITKRKEELSPNLLRNITLQIQLCGNQVNVFICSSSS